MIPILLPIGALLSGVALLLLGTGLMNTLLALRGSAEGFSDQTLGLLGSAYFLGFIVGTYVCPKLIRRMGHIRSFAFFCAATAVSLLLHGLVIDAWFWFALRLLTGVSLVGLYMVIESWLNTQAPNDRRGQVFAVYMVVNLVALALAQQMLRIDSPLLFTLFAVGAIFLVLAIMPVAMTKLPQPTITDTPAMSLRRLWDVAPVAFSGALLSGVAMGAFWGLGAVWAGRMGMATEDIASFVSLVIITGAVMQWPLGLLSDRIDRRVALALIAGISAVGGLLMAILGVHGNAMMIGAVVFGAGAFAAYPVVVAHLVDHLHQEEILAGSSALLLVQGAGSALGPTLAGALMSATVPSALPLFFAVMFGLCAAFALLQSRKIKDVIVDEPAHFVPMVRTSTASLEMMAEDQMTSTETAHTTEAEQGPDNLDTPDTANEEEIVERRSTG
ncbi:Predicted arabinose efflux permease, MFS family [Halopseudomonas xinjiangensis]|uniref:Predicted arabinose efflux permease, MFS family n=1 Tax=Halopseudomonas xinjiangensis TaxID=487184 RepID=A0A1H1SJI7_9GAMM|nr:MFS transporter [Halopseudomonas xinjiangensis]SDS48091.1 Predicted arabinose efflux permease, MFS family [Halopseudomonas xinjiangensis]